MTDSGTSSSSRPTWRPARKLLAEQPALSGKVDFGGISKEVCLAYVPEVEVGDYTVVHVGFAISKVDEEEAKQVFSYLEAMDDLAELEIAQPETT